MKAIIVLVLGIWLAVGFVAGIEVETNYCKSYYEGFKR